MRKTLTLLLLLLAISGGLPAANSITTVSQVTSAVTVSADEDYVITSTTPFAGSGSVNITNLDHAVVVIQNIKPSVVLKNWLTNRVYINGVQAVDGTNCEVRMYAQGAIIFPYDKDYKPLTVYSEQNYQGTSCNDFGLENTGGFMNSLNTAKLNNQIRSFKLKRGYMVTFSTRAGGRGYSRCFIADRADLEFATLPIVLDGTISSYRVFRWYNAAKKGLASNGDKAANQALNTSWCYDWAEGNANNLPDCEWVPNHIYEDWPSPSTCGGVTGSCHMKTNNEPANQSDDHPQSVETILANWENLMRTGMRLCTPSSWDGSDYWNGTGSVIKVLLDSIDARGWRCDIVDAHCYWPSGNFSNLENYWWPSYKRPIWISEWIWGASWGTNATNKGAFADGVTDAQIVSTTKNILNTLNSMGCVERYAYWNSESKGHIYENGHLTELGQYYASMKTGLGYNADYQYIPTNPRQYAPSDLVVKMDGKTQEVTLTWHDYNGEYNKSMEIQERKFGTYTWKTIQNVALQEEGADYSVTISGKNGDRYRIRLVDANGTEYLTNEGVAVSNEMNFGDGVSYLDNTTVKTLYLGGNMLLNGDFLLGNYGWTNGAGEPLAAPYYQVVPEGGVDNSPYLQCFGNNSSFFHAQSIAQEIALQRNQIYYASMAGLHCTADQRIATVNQKDDALANVRVRFTDQSTWSLQGGSFKVGVDTCLMVQVRNAAGKAQIDEVKVCRLFETPEEALLDALNLERQRVSAYISLHQAEAPALMAQLQQLLDSDADANALEKALQETHRALLDNKRLAERETLTTQLEKLLSSDAEPYALVSDKLSNPDFVNSNGWNVKAGTYTGGDQRLASQAGSTCWNAWWSNAVTGDDHPTLSINQTTAALEHGLYALQCKATTEHYCETDQHGWLYNPATDETLNTEVLPIGVLDLPAFSAEDKWRELTTSYTYVEEGNTLTVGFTSSKTAADKGRFIPYGKPTATPDNREGWWCATDFVLRHIPVLQLKVDNTGWGTICLPANVTLPVNMTFYESVGILADGQSIALREVAEPQPGYPYLFYTTVRDTVLSLYEHGSKITTAKTNINGFRGVLKAPVTLRYPLNSFRFVDGAFVKVTESGISVPSFSVMIYKQSQLPVIDSYAGVTVPIVGATAGLQALEADQQDVEGLDLLGRRTQQQGLTIRNKRVVFVK